MKFEYKDNCCLFCNPETRGKFNWEGIENIVGHEDTHEEGYCLEENDCLYATADDPYCGTGALKINYCPMCGRSLKVVNKLQQIEKDFK